MDGVQRLHPEMNQLRGVSRRSAIASFAAAALAAACRRTPANADRGALDSVAERYVRGALALAQHQPSLIEAWWGAEAWRPGPRRPVSQVRADIDAATEAFASMALAAREGERGRYLHRQLAALSVAARRLSGETMRFGDEARAALGDEVAALLARVPTAGGSDAPEMQSARNALGQYLPGKGALHSRYAAFRRHAALPRERVLGAAQAALDVCRAHMPRSLVLPASEAVTIEATANLGLEARALYESNYRTGVVIDTAGSLDLARVVWLVAHECYPGHHVQFVLGDRDVMRARQWQERALFPAFGAHLLCAEGAADAAAWLLLEGNVYEQVGREVARRARLPVGDIGASVAIHRLVAELDLTIAAIARSFLDGELRTDAAAELLSTRALVTDAHQLLRVIERQRTRILAYPLGRRLVVARLAGTWEQRFSRLAHIATTMSLT
jgi:hypothetical protein